MKFIEIEWKNIFAYGEETQKITYDNGQLTLLKGKSGSGKSTILLLPSILLYGKTEKKLTKSGIANRCNKHGWIRGTIEKNGHVYTIERSFAPNDLQVFKDGVNIDAFGSSAAQDYIDNEIADIPLKTFSNMISISMKKFKSFLTMSPADRKEIIDRIFNLEAINIAYDMIKKDARDIGSAINANNTTLFQLTQTLQNATTELENVRAKSLQTVDKSKIDENNQQINKDNENIEKLMNAYTEYSNKQQEYTEYINNLKKQQYENNFNINAIQEKINLFSQAKCPTCGTSFTGEGFQNLLQQLNDLKKQKDEISNGLQTQLTEANNSYSQIYNYLNQINEAVYKFKADISSLTMQNQMIETQLNESAEYTGIQNIITQTTQQMDIIKEALSEDTKKLKDLQNLAVVFSIDGVKQKVIINYLPILNQEICHNLEMVEFPYQVDIDSKFDPHLRELGIEIEPDSLSDGEEMRVDLIILCSLFKLLKRRFPSINILTIDEVISSLDSETSGQVLDYLKMFAKENNLCCFIVSHTDLFIDNFDKIINVKKDGFSRIDIIENTI
ncbi:MAG: SbcC-like subunit of palindrome specific endonuclease [Wendovervirus sonii]|uniref:SbcC-like subunit of palindrome specific endonuclease n=1 Tax=phage Lak_Megaphage_Sonny TaxID=3109229 RepID=A0ABZ0Z416_9CAUD|nr:MAG: SbcC-like subunit of palindrome specific endonuclease [phage Lak_Megaphage_Sonny]